MKFELKDVIMMITISVAFGSSMAINEWRTDDHNARIAKLEALKLEQLAGRVERMACRVRNLKAAIKNAPEEDCDLHN